MNEAVREHLEKVLSSPGFTASPRLARFLRFIVEHRLDGKLDAIQEYVIGVEVFDRKELFDPRVDSIVRVEAHRRGLTLALSGARAGQEVTTMPRMIAAALVAFAALPLLCAAEREERTTCSTADFKGRYAFYTQGTNLLTNAQILFAGTLLADGNGRITEWKDWVATPLSPATPPAFKTVELRDIFEQAGRDIRYTVENDCRMTINALVAVPGGRTPVVLVGGLAGRPRGTPDQRGRGRSVPFGDDLETHGRA